ncbi:hypothetical protein TNCV_4393111 [Trichonephila clavipes]|nr:hypothetical protein TNCV_4393111 [Trichonephila clavipes]
MRSVRDQSPSLPIDVLGISLQRVPHVEAWRVGCHFSSPPRHSTEVPNDTVLPARHRGTRNISRTESPLERLMVGEEECKTPEPSLGVFFLKIWMGRIQKVLSIA